MKGELVPFQAVVEPHLTVGSIAKKGHCGSAVLELVSDFEFAGHDEKPSIRVSMSLLQISAEKEKSDRHTKGSFVATEIVSGETAKFLLSSQIYIRLNEVDQRRRLGCPMLL